MRPGPIVLALSFTFGFTATSLQAQGTSKVEGKITAIVKDSKTSTGTITLDVNGKATKFMVSEFTRFEIVRGNEHHHTNFLAEHRGENAAIYPIPDSNPLAAAKVQIILAPLPHIQRGAPKPGHVPGIVTDLTPTTVTIRVDHKDPLAPVLGKVSDVAYDQDKGLGTITVQGKAKGDKGESFIITAATAIFKIKGRDWERVSFLSEQKGQRVLVFLNPYQPKVATRVEILLGDPSEAKYLAHVPHHNYLVSYLLTTNTEVEFVRDGKHLSTKADSLKVGEHISVLPTGVHAHIAKHVHILLPHTVHGEVVSASTSALKIKMHHKDKKEGAADLEVVFPVTARTKIESVQKKEHTAATLAALVAGAKVEVLPEGTPPHAAGLIEVHGQAGKTAAKGVAKGIVTSVGTGATSVVIKVYHPAKGDKPAHDELETYQLNAMTKIEQGKTAVAASSAALLGKEVTLHWVAGSPPVAVTIEIKAAKKSK